MIIFRSITKKETEVFIDFAFHSGLGMVSMPKNRARLTQIVQHAEHSFQRPISQPGDEHYLFVLEDLNTGAIQGTSGIYAKTGLDHPFYFYRKEYIQRTNHHIPSLRMVHYFSMPSEIGSLYLSPDLRHQGYGKLLSLSRFLFIASHLNRFDPYVFAVMLGYCEKDGSCPFWNGIGRHFCPIEFDELMKQQNLAELDIPSLFPNYPIYPELLPENVQKSIGKVHPDSLAALNMLIQEGFQLTNEIDFIDGGPKIEAETNQIRTIKQSILATIHGTELNDVSIPYDLLCNNQLQFRCCYAQIECVDHKNHEIIISEEVASALRVKVGDQVRYVKLIE